MRTKRLSSVSCQPLFPLQGTAQKAMAAWLDLSIHAVNNIGALGPAGHHWTQEQVFRPVHTTGFLLFLFSRREKKATACYFDLYRKQNALRAYIALVNCHALTLEVGFSPPLQTQACLPTASSKTPVWIGCSPAVQQGKRRTNHPEGKQRVLENS